VTLWDALTKEQTQQLEAACFSTACLLTTRPVSAVA